MSKREEIDKFRVCSLPFYKGEAAKKEYDEIYRKRKSSQKRVEAKLKELEWQLYYQTQSIARLEDILKVKQNELEIIKDKISECKKNLETVAKN